MARQLPNVCSSAADSSGCSFKWAANGFARRTLLVAFPQLVVYDLRDSQRSSILLPPEVSSRAGHEMDDILSDLRQALGLHTGDISQELVAQPYIEYIKASWTGRGERQDFLRFFVEVVRHFRGTSTIF